MKLFFLYEDLSQSISILSDKYDMDLEQIQSISSQVPEHALEWTVKQISEKQMRWPEDSNRLNQAFTWYAENKKNAKFQALTKEVGKNHRNILNFTLHDIEGFQDKLSGVDKSKRQQVRELKQEGAEVVYDKHGYKLIKITSAKAATYYAKGTRWCVSNEEVAEDYLIDGPLYLILKGNRKIALYHDMQEQFMDVEDQEYAIDDEKEANIFLDMGLDILYGDIRTRIPKLEDIIKQDPASSYKYAKDVIKGRWPEGEEAIKKDPRSAFRYAHHVIKGRWPEGEEAIKKDPLTASYYARHIIQDRWPEGEEAIKKDPLTAYDYAYSFIKSRWPEGEEAIKKDPRTAFYYANSIIKGRWPEGEEAIKKDDSIYQDYKEFLADHR